MTTIHLSDWSTRPDPTLPGGLCHCPEVLARYPGGTLIGSPVPFGGRSLVGYRTSDAEREADWRYPRLSDGAALRLLASDDRLVSVEEYREALRGAHDRRLSEIRIQVVLDNEYVLMPATLAYQQYLAGVAVVALLGQPRVTLAIGDRVAQLTGRVLIGIARQYCDDLTRTPPRHGGGAVDHLALRGRIEVAQTIEQCDAITID